MPLVPVRPLGSLIYQSPTPVTGTVAFAGDTDDYTINLDKGQVLSVALTGTESPTIQMFDPFDTLVLLPLVSSCKRPRLPTDGVYTVRIGQEGSGMGLYSLSVVLNAAVEPENYGGAPQRHSGAAGPGPHSVALGDGADRLAAVDGGHRWRLQRRVR